MSKILNFIAGIVFSIGVIALIISFTDIISFGPTSEPKIAQVAETGKKSEDISEDFLKLLKATSTVEYYETKSPITQSFRDLIIMAEAGYRQLKQKPAISGMFEIENIQLPPGYTIYQAPIGGASLESYVYYKGQKSVADYMEEKELWFGPF